VAAEAKGSVVVAGEQWDEAERVRQMSKGQLADSLIAVSPYIADVWDEKTRETARCSPIKEWNETDGR
jgi:hypothetical protein